MLSSAGCFICGIFLFFITHPAVALDEVGLSSPKINIVLQSPAGSSEIVYDEGIKPSRFSCSSSALNLYTVDEFTSISTFIIPNLQDDEDSVFSSMDLFDDEQQLVEDAGMDQEKYEDEEDYPDEVMLSFKSFKFNITVIDIASDKSNDEQADPVEEAQVPSLVEAQVPSLEEAQVPSLEEAQNPSLQEAQVPSLEEAQVPSLEEAQVPSLEEAQVPSLQEAQVPSLQEAQVPSLEEAQLPSLQEAQVPSLQHPQVPSLQEGQVPSLQEAQVPSLQEGRVAFAQGGQVPSVQETEKLSVQNDALKGQNLSPTTVRTESSEVGIPGLLPDRSGSRDRDIGNKDTFRMGARKGRRPISASRRHYVNPEAEVNPEGAVAVPEAEVNPEGAVAVPEAEVNPEGAVAVPEDAALSYIGGNELVNGGVRDETLRMLQSGNEFLATSEIVDVYTIPNELLSENISGFSTSEFQVVYVCKKVGEARISLDIKTSSGVSVCISWRKRCDATWGKFQISEVTSGVDAFRDSMITSEWKRYTTEEEADAEDLAFSSLQSKGSSSQFSFTTTSGAYRLSRAIVSSSNSKVIASARGWLSANEEPITIDTASQETLDILYSCPDAKELESSIVSLTLTNEQPLIPPIELHWRAECSYTLVPQLTVAVSSCSKKDHLYLRDHTEMAYEKEELKSSFTPSSSSPFKVHSADDCTKLRISTPSEIQIPDLWPHPSIQFNRKIVWISPHASDQIVKLDNTAILTIPYTCLEEGAAPVRTTLHFRDAPALELEWIKMCEKPKTRTGYAFTARAGLALAMSGLVALCFFCFFIRTGRLRTLWKRQPSSILRNVEEISPLTSPTGTLR